MRPDLTSILRPTMAPRVTAVLKWPLKQNTTANAVKPAEMAPIVGALIAGALRVHAHTEKKKINVAKNSPMYVRAAGDVVMLQHNNSVYTLYVTFVLVKDLKV